MSTNTLSEGDNLPPLMIGAFDHSNYDKHIPVLQRQGETHEFKEMSQQTDEGDFPGNISLVNLERAGEGPSQMTLRVIKRKPIVSNDMSKALQNRLIRDRAILN